MKTETVNIEKWKTFDWGVLQSSKKNPVHIKITTMDSELIADVYNKGHAELIKEATNACKEINKDNPLNVAKAIPEMFKALIRWQEEWVGNGTPAQRANNYSIELQINEAIEKATKQ